ncbi:hypothetical protein ES703_77075 [subsurface metagenome]
MDTKPSMPKWFTPVRKNYLVQLFLKSGGFCVFGHRPCPYPEHHYESYIEGLIRYWIDEDRARDNAQWQAEKLILHKTAERSSPLHGQFSGVERDIFYANQPLYYIEGLGIGVVQLKPFAKVRLASSFLRLHIDLGNALREATKNQKRKAIRYGKPLPPSIEEKVSELIKNAVTHYLNH